MWRKVLNIVSWCLLAAYLGVSLWYTGQQRSRELIRSVVVIITDSLESHFITPAEVTGILAKNGVRTTGTPVGQVNRDQVKNTVKTVPGVRDALVYSTPGGTLYIQLNQRKPVMRYVSPFASFYIDSEGKEMALSPRYSARVLMVTGAADRKFLKDSLFPVIMSIRSEPFLDALIGELAVAEDHTIEVISRVGSHRIFFGDAANHEWKLTKLKAFYEQGLPNVGWERYSRIDLRYGNQVVARRWTPQELKARDSVRASRDTLPGKKLIKKV
jgi:cell division protein FtsQ